MLLAGVADKGGIASVTDYTMRSIHAQEPDFPIFLQRSRFGTGAMLHLSVPAALAQFGYRIVRRRVALCHINVAHAGSVWRKMLFAQVARLAGVRLILHLHGSGFDEFYARCPAFARGLMRGFFRSADRVVVLGEHWHRFCARELRVHPTRLLTISNGVPAPTRQAVPDRPVPRIVFAGQLGERKGVDVLLAALAALTARGIDFTAGLYGDGPVERYRAMAAGLGLSASRVSLHGWTDGPDIATAMAEADIFVLPSRAENQPIAILEAMAHGLPVVSTRIGAIPEQVVDGETGMLVPPGEVEALTEALADLAVAPQRRMAMGAAGRVRWQRLYSTETNAAALLQVYRGLVARSLSR